MAESYLDSLVQQYPNWDKKNYDRLTELLTHKLQFGTAGLRAEMGAGFSRMNDLTVLQATQDHVPGYKVYWDNGCQIIPPLDAHISQHIEENQKPWDWNYDLVNSNPLVVDVYEQMTEEYFKAISLECKFRKENFDFDEKVSYTAMHGVGTLYAKRMAKEFGFKEENFVCVKEQCDPDPAFPTVEYPNPEEGKGAMALAFETASKCGAKLILANDPDADRLSISEWQNEIFRIFSGNEIGSMLGVYLYKQHVLSGSTTPVAFLASTVSSKFLQRVASKHGFHFEETLTGFKWLGTKAKELASTNKVLLAYEEAIGFMATNAVYDKDGVSALAIVMEMYAWLRRQDKTLSQFLDECFQTYGFVTSYNCYLKCKDVEKIKTMFEKLRYGQDTDERQLKYPSSFGEFQVDSVRDLTIGYDSSTSDNVPLLPTSSSTQMITFHFSKGDQEGVVTIRTSGTEPKIKFYSELVGRDGSDDGSTIQRVVEEIQGKFTAESIPKLPTPQPTHNNISCKLEFQGFMPDHLDFYAYFARYSAHALGLPCSPIIHLPTATKRWTIVKGPFVHAKSKENFEQKTHKRSVELFDANEDMREKWIEYVEKNLPDGVDLKIVRFDWVGEGDVKSVIEKAKQEIKEFEESGKKGANVPFHVKVEERAKEFLKHLGS
ncbi:Phosphoglucomutase-2 [Nowakowskiella sp. JEL0407]|nr:Phosphoglucomutase-2 [Nowakowskiella sp. JEL0407]